MSFCSACRVSMVAGVTSHSLVAIPSPAQTPQPPQSRGPRPLPQQYPASTDIRPISSSRRRNTPLPKLLISVFVNKLPTPKGMLCTHERGRTGAPTRAGCVLALALVPAFAHALASPYAVSAPFDAGSVRQLSVRVE